MDPKEKIENVKLDLQNVDTMTDVKHNPVISAFVSSIKTVPFLGDLIDDSLEYTLTEFQNRKQQQLLEVINNASVGSVTSDMPACSSTRLAPPYRMIWLSYLRK